MNEMRKLMETIDEIDTEFEYDARELLANHAETIEDSGELQELIDALIAALPEQEAERILNMWTAEEPSDVSDNPKFNWSDDQDDGIGW